ncbi:hypothetical protein BCR34DRAFT_591613 [Clohesyomyces aquaticus]|uniref:Transmembrane protein n=1 Tax=Clohesyomyces aquaticus TaxID=1231657 RepID=A0A1Y1YZF1_9PLEO|nr:hypothetical protein BCR34DRAFT_591613 [Clohesyomyces aquaticus]
MLGQPVDFRPQLRRGLLGMSSDMLKMECKDKISTINTKVGFAAFGIIVLTIAIEMVVNTAFVPSKPTKADASTATAAPDGGDVGYTPVPAPEAVPATTTANTDTPTAASPADSSIDHWCAVSPLPSTRARRFVTATFLIVPATLLFVYIIKHLDPLATIPVQTRCQKFVDPTPVKHWWLVSLFVLLPFTSAAIAWLRSLVSCVLMRWDKGLSYTVWPVCLPGFAFVVPVVACWYLMTWCAGLVMGRPVDDEGNVKDVELGVRNGDGQANVAEEERALVGDWDDGAHGEGYDEDDDVTVYSPTKDEGNVMKGESV